MSTVSAVITAKSVRMDDYGCYDGEILTSCCSG